MITELKNAFDDALVTDFAQLTASMTNHPKDRHVLAAAVAAQAQLIATSNLKDFPIAALSAHNIVALSPDDFLSDLFNQRPMLVSGIIVDLVRDLRRPPTTLEAELATLEKQLPTFIKLVREQLGE